MPGSPLWMDAETPLPHTSLPRIFDMCNHKTACAGAGVLDRAW